MLDGDASLTFPSSSYSFWKSLEHSQLSQGSTIHAGSSSPFPKETWQRSGLRAQTGMSDGWEHLDWESPPGGIPNFAVELPNPFFRLPHAWLRLGAAPSREKAAWDCSRNSRRDGTCLCSRCQLPHPPCRIFRAGKGNVRPSLPSPAAPAPGKQRRDPSIPFSTSLECRRPGWSKLG